MAENSPAGLLWDYMVKQQEFSVTTFATALIGEGALLFAYGSLISADDLVRVTIALLGIGTGIVLTIHSFIARREALAIQRLFESNSKPLDAALKVIHQWRGNLKRLGPVTKLMTFVDGLIVIMWSTILLHVVGGFPQFSGWLHGPWFSLAIFVIDLLAGIAWWFALNHYETIADRKVALATVPNQPT